MTLEALVEIIVEELDVEAAEVVPTASFIDDLGADSLDLFELVMSIEDAFGVAIPNEELANIKTVQDVLDYAEANA
ncbi:acyl carrier protein [Petrocella atlantisensis]|uniref:Acyl carrier protein n=1 Tax=Petrocella atlantisensis TaxID=2173034 RepID=A0A3P7PV22_9FIRM|nr:acyl carrier protein [Petrocella atlantisensis]MCF8020201.1 acyl carrier protein [Vallitaleaceae bacterium]PKM54429.1 MAG: acyl carrier protein [Firmicutes bacterium HGW-Firmicutes-5]VDN47777.1 acyl carrier protein [Petrocella atlantisensis]